MCTVSHSQCKAQTLGEHVWATAVSAVTVLKTGLTLRWTKTRNLTNSLEALTQNYSGLYINGDEPKGCTTREIVHVTCLSVKIMNLSLLCVPV
jgi:hypothetical protein